MISIAAKCSEVWGCGHDSLPALDGQERVHVNTCINTLYIYLLNTLLV